VNSYIHSCPSEMVVLLIPCAPPVFFCPWLVGEGGGSSVPGLVRWLGSMDDIPIAFPITGSARWIAIYGNVVAGFRARGCADIRARRKHPIYITSL
jgi:hypothetical protein